MSWNDWQPRWITHWNFDDITKYNAFSKGTKLKSGNQVTWRHASAHQVELPQNRKQIDHFGPDITVVAFHVPWADNRNMKEVAEHIVHEGLGLSTIVVYAMRTRDWDRTPGIIKIWFESLHDKIILCDKQFLRSSQTPKEWLMRLNDKTLLEEMPHGTDFWLTGNGRIIRKALAMRLMTKAVCSISHRTRMVMQIGSGLARGNGDGTPAMEPGAADGDVVNNARSPPNLT